MESVSSGLGEAATFTSAFVSGLVDYSPRLLGAALVLIVGWFLARLAGLFTRRLLRSFNTVLYRRWRSTAVSRIRLSSSTIGMSTSVVRWSLLFFSLTIATQVLGLAALSDWLDSAVAHLPAVVAGGLVVFVGYVVSQFAREIVVSILQPTVGVQAVVFGKLTQAVVVAAALVIGLGQAGIDTTLLVSIVVILLAGLFGGMSLAFGLGAKDMVANVIGTHYARKDFLIGQGARVGGIEGEILRITPTAVVLETPDGQAVVPGGLFQREAILILDAEADLE